MICYIFIDAWFFNVTISFMALKREPIEINDNNWYYEEEKYITVIHEVRYPDGSYIRTDAINIPWKRLLESIRRKYGTK